MMVEPLRLVSFAAVMFGIALVPGASAAYCLAAGLDQRHSFTFAAAAGVTLGKLTHLAVAALGAFWVAQLHAGVRIGMLAAAAAFMLVEGMRRWLGLSVKPTNGASSVSSSAMVQGFAVSIVNPQSLASALAVFPLFVSVETSTLGVVSLLASATIAVFAAYVIYEGVAAMAVRRLTARSQTRVVGATYILAATGLALAAVI